MLPKNAASRAGGIGTGSKRGTERLAGAKPCDVYAMRDSFPAIPELLKVLTKPADVTL